MKICSQCGTEMKDSDVYCRRCGSKLDEQKQPAYVYCTNCGNKMNSKAIFCTECGARLATAFSSPTPPVDIPNSPAEKDLGQTRTEVMPPLTEDSDSSKSENITCSENPVSSSVESDNTPSDSFNSTDKETTATSFDSSKNDSGSMDDNESLLVPAGNNPGSESNNSSDHSVHNDLSETNQNWYITDFIKSTIARHNIPTIIYLCLNVIIIVFIYYSFARNIALSIILALTTYAVSLFIALSPVGETMMRRKTHCQEITDSSIAQRIVPLFNSARKQADLVASREGVTIPPDVLLYMNDDKDPNAFATGRRTVCFTKGLLMLPDDQIIATFCHEFGHITHHDTDLLLAITVGNFIVTLVYNILRIFLIIFGYLLKAISVLLGIFSNSWLTGRLASLNASIATLLSIWLIDAIMFLWTKLGTLLVMKSSREEEFKADGFAYNCGFGNALCELLNFVNSSNQPKSKGLFEALSESHPAPTDRIDALRKLGATY